jgi:hypothetical protein
MNEKYVKLSDVKKKLNYIYRTYGVSQQMKKTVSDAIARIPYIVKGELETTLEAELVIHGKWKHVSGMNSKCSECGRYFPVKEFESRPFDINYCPNCGAKMDGGVSDETIHDKK